MTKIHKPVKLEGKTILVTGAAKRLGKSICLALAEDGADIILHYGKSHQAAIKLADEITRMGVNVYPKSANLLDTRQIETLVHFAETVPGFFGLVNNASIFDPISFEETDVTAWNDHIQINLTAPFLFSKAFTNLPEGRIINMLDWRALRPGSDHFPYTISKSGLAALTRSLAVTLAPRIAVNGIALGAILPPSNGKELSSIIDPVPAKRWAKLEELTETVKFLLTGPAYITGEIIHLDGGRHLI